MPRKQHSEEQIIGALKQHEAGSKTGEICRKLGISQATFYNCKKHYGGLGVQELRELRKLREENGRLKRIVADVTLDRRSCRRSSQKSSEASPETPFGEADTAGVSSVRTASHPGGRHSPKLVSLSQPLQQSRRIAAAVKPTGRHARALWIPALNGLAQTRRLARQRETNLSPVPRGRLDRPNQTT